MLFTYISNTWYLITVPNMNKNQPIFSLNITIYTQNVRKMGPQLFKFGKEPNFILQA